MKQYTTTNFNIQNCVDVGLNIIDSAILDWILTFSRSGNMRCIEEQDKIWYWVNLSALISDYANNNGCWFGITTTDALSRRIAKLAKLNVLKKRIVHSFTDKNGVEYKGSYLFVCLNSDLILFLTGEKESADRNDMQNPKAQISDNDIKILEEDKLNTNFFIHSPEINPDRSGIKNNEGAGCKVGTNITKLYNHKAISSLITPETEKQTEQNQADLRSMINERLHKNFNTSPDIVFEGFDIASAIKDTCAKLNVTDPENIMAYIDFTYKTVKNRKDIMFKNKYFSKVVANTDFALQYFDSHKIEQQKVYNKKCPVCGTVHSIADAECPECHIVHDQYEAEVELYKKIYALPIEQRKKLKYELEVLAAGFGVNFNIPKYKALTAEVYKRYGIDIKRV